MRGLGGPFATAANSFESAAMEINKDWPFVLEKYIRIENKTQTNGSTSEVTNVNNRSENLHDIVNMQDWDTYVRGLKADGLEGDISDLWGNLPLQGETEEMEGHTHNYEVDDRGNGITSTHVDASGVEHYHVIENGVLQRAVMNDEDNGHKHEIEVTGWKFGLRLSYIVESERNDVFEGMVGTIDESTIMNSKSYRLESPDGVRYILPVASAELPIPDQDFTLFDPDSYDVYCLIQELIKTTDYEFWFKYLFPLSRFTSLFAIYTAQGFYASLGNTGYPVDGGDMWEKPGGNRGITRFRRWNRGDLETFPRSRREARDLFTTLYDSAASIDHQSENKYGHKNSPTSFRDLLRPRANFDLGLRWWQTGPWIKNRPFDKDGNECD